MNFTPNKKIKYNNKYCVCGHTLESHLLDADGPPEHCTKLTCDCEEFREKVFSQRRADRNTDNNNTDNNLE